MPASQALLTGHLSEHPKGQLCLSSIQHGGLPARGPREGVTRLMVVRLPAGDLPCYWITSAFSDGCLKHHLPSLPLQTAAFCICQVLEPGWVNIPTKQAADCLAAVSTAATPFPFLHSLWHQKLWSELHPGYRVEAGNLRLMLPWQQVLTVQCLITITTDAAMETYFDKNLSVGLLHILVSTNFLAAVVKQSEQHASRHICEVDKVPLHVPAFLLDPHHSQLWVAASQG